MMRDAPTAPFFIVGSPRSGTTLLRYMIGRHPRLFIPGETGFVPFLRVPVDAPLSRDQVSALVRRIGRLNPAWKGMVGDVDALFDALSTRRPADVLDALYRMRMSEDGAERWGDKTPLYVQYMPYLDRLFPDAQFIHVIRDGRDAVLSAMERWGREKPYFDPYYLLSHWVRNVNAGRKTGGSIGSGRYLEVHYEDLVAEPETVLRSICHFLGEPFEPVMLGGKSPDRGDEGRIGYPIDPEAPASPAHVGRWIEEMTVFDKRLADRLAGPTLADFGYPRVQVGPFTPSQSLRAAYLAAKFAVSDAIRTLLYKWGILTLNRKWRIRPW